MNFLFALLFSLFIADSALALDVPPLKSLVTDLAGMFPPASLEDLDQRLRRFKTETANDVVVLTVKSLDGEDIEKLTRATFAALPLDDAQRRRSVLLVVARKERQFAFHAGSQLQALLPEPVASAKLQAQVALYWDGLRPDLGIHGAVHYLLRVIRGDIRVGSQTEEEKLEETSSRGREAGAIFAFYHGPCHSARRVWQSHRILDVGRLERHSARKRTAAQARRQNGHMMRLRHKRADGEPVRSPR